MCQKAEMQFSVFLMHQLAQNWHKTPAEVFNTLNKTGILDDYISDDSITELRKEMYKGTGKKIKYRV